VRDKWILWLNFAQQKQWLLQYVRELWRRVNENVAEAALLFELDEGQLGRGLGAQVRRGLVQTLAEDKRNNDVILKK
jgi:hypothetical protein